MNNEMLHPNCSEVCWRLDLTITLPIKEQICEALQKTKHDDEEDYNMHGEGSEIDDTFYEILETLQKLKERKLPYQKVTLEFGDGGGGGGDYNAVENAFNYAMDICDGKMTTAKALKKLHEDDDE
jgi:hypothetical protein